MNNGDGHSKLACWFGLSYASFLTLPRVLMNDMPDEWQKKMANLLNEMDDTFPNVPISGYRVQATEGGKLTRFPKWVIRYRYPDKAELKKARKK